MSALLESGAIPAPKLHSFAAENVSDAFDYMARAQHIGRIAVMHPAFGHQVARKDSSYLISGGLGALGMHAARWLAESGAGRVVLLGRSAP
ncbi:MAG: KR domain-containing protein, partial [Pseudomonadota bacterium]